MTSSVPHGAVTIGGVESEEDDPMTAAEFHMVREALGLTMESLAGIVGVAARSVRRWEQGSTPIPDGVRTLVEDLEAAADQQVEVLAAALRDAPKVVLNIPGSAVGGISAGYWRMLAWRVAREVPGLTVRYSD